MHKQEAPKQFYWGVHQVELM